MAKAACEHKCIPRLADRPKLVQDTPGAPHGVANILQIAWRKFRSKGIEDLHGVCPDANVIFAAVVGVNALPYQRAQNDAETQTCGRQADMEIIILRLPVFAGITADCRNAFSPIRSSGGRQAAGHAKPDQVDITSPTRSDRFSSTPILAARPETMRIQ